MVGYSVHRPADTGNTLAGEIAEPHSTSGGPASRIDLPLVSRNLATGSVP